MRTIHKYELFPETVLDIPRGATVLSVQVQREKPYLWAEVDTSNELTKRKFIGVGTGHTIPSEARLSFIGTVQLEGGALVFHIYEVLP
jgi:hypothetical protein